MFLIDMFLIKKRVLAWYVMMMIIIEVKPKSTGAVHTYILILKYPVSSGVELN